MQPFLDFLSAHPGLTHTVVGLLVAGVIANFAVWPPPTDPRKRLLWSLFVRLLVKGWNEYGGPWKIPGIVFPEPPPLEPPPEPKTPEPPAADRITLPGGRDPDRPDRLA